MIFKFTYAHVFIDVEQYFKKTIQNQYGEQNCRLNVKPCLKCDERAQNNTHKEL